MSEATQTAVAHFSSGYNCSQSVLMALCAPYGLDTDAAARLATGFGVGMYRGATCGAVSGAMLALGLFGGGGGPDGAAAKAATYDRIEEFYARFRRLHGSLVCRELIGLDPSTPEGLERARREGRFQTLCLSLVRDAAEIAAAIIAEK
ncbi:C_GCAxxG_C_C family protein [Solidesulfovibrio fructosivorans JJ]]|uniref:C_GCAxxG_C_C family protein n=1 Tax=Solidesulfovibrio fructosivorans JJ] TaxID=596151 RepID=E1JYV4_SOLFR|nr:C-GCAxxG-C-C family protein [Solidesulfovibrio fructosivorans]EFL50524.1 C_GCAxxG_C_C family protein [Solidesulfovibrio fructosivorans JJ]]